MTYDNNLAEQIYSQGEYEKHLLQVLDKIPKDGLLTPNYESCGIKLFNTDCRNIMPLLNSESIDLVVTDPPYGMGKFRTDVKDYLKTVGPALKMAWHLLKQNGSMFVFTSTAEIANVANALGQPIKRTFWMYKPGKCAYPLAGWILKSEAILWFHKGKRIHLAERRPYKHDTYIVKKIGKEGVEGHPTVKPMEVVRDLVSRCPEGGTILDPFTGSGTTLVAAIKCGRKAIGMEIEEKYYEMAKKRVMKELNPLFH